MEKYISVLAVLLFISAALLNAQSENCDNAGFEFGTVNGYSTFVGEIEGNGAVIVNTPGIDPDRHRIMHISEGVDPIAALHCATNTELPVVPQGAGQYSMRLGNAFTGAEAERVILDLTVTEENSFFLLSYAVVLQDPGHPEHQQPRFELRILDENDQVFPCGVYEVRAAENIEGFENCGGWRVRPWTTAGFELQSYIGQNIKIEILTTDCSQGGHAGYAYFDASCQPLELRLNGYCPGTTSAEIYATEGFEEYAWSTGDTTNVISIENPIAGTEYSVTLTSATGCTLVLTDTLPTIEEVSAPIFNNVSDTSICPGNSFWFMPTGQNLDEVFSPTLGFSADSFLIAPQSSIDYVFLASDEYGCSSDTIIYTVTVSDSSTTILVSSVIIDSTKCFDSQDGSINIMSNAISYLWLDGSTSSFLSDLEAGSYIVKMFDEYGCFAERSYEVESPSELILNSELINVSCFGAADGSIEVFPQGGSAPYYNAANDTVVVVLLDSLTSGPYEVEVTDNNGCLIATNLTINQPDSIALSMSQDSVRCFGEMNGASIVNAMGGTPPYLYLWSDNNMQTLPQAFNIPTGIYSVTITDDKGCVKSDSVQVEEPAVITIDITEIDSTRCHDSSDGMASVVASGGNGGFTYQWNDANQQTSPTASGLSMGVYEVEVIDNKGCNTEISLTIPSPLPLLVSHEVDSVRCFGEANGRILILPSGGDGNYTYVWEHIPQSDSYLTDLASGEYTVSVIDAKGCEKSSIIKVHEPELLGLNVLNQSFPDCSNNEPGVTTVGATGGNGNEVFQWSNGIQGSSVSTFHAEELTVTITDYKGCTFSTSINTLGFEAVILPDGPFVDDFLAICEGDEVRLTIQGNNLIEDVMWASNGSVNCPDCLSNLISPTDSMYYTAFLTDIDGCVDTASIYIPLNQYSSKINIVGDEQFICFGDRVNLNIEAHPAAQHIIWVAIDTIDCADCTQISDRPAFNTTYKAYLQHVNGCSSVPEAEVIVDKRACPQFIPNAFSPNGDSKNDFFNIPSSRSIVEIERFEVFDRWGGQVYMEKNVTLGEKGWNGKIAGNDCPTGTYTYQIHVRHFNGERSVYSGDVNLIR